MAAKWIDLDQDEKMKSFSSEFWNQHRQNLADGKFWADKIKNYRDDPNNRLETALNNLPLPAAFREAMISIRKIISEKRKRQLDISDDLNFLYKLGIVSSMMLDYSEKLAMPGYNVMETIPGGLLCRLDIPYLKLGYSKIKLFNKTDCKMFVEAWGEPQDHLTMNEYYKEIWLKYENAYSTSLLH
jgi:hypothetical protein